MAIPRPPPPPRLPPPAPLPPPPPLPSRLTIGPYDIAAIAGNARHYATSVTFPSEPFSLEQCHADIKLFHRCVRPLCSPPAASSL